MDGCQIGDLECLVELSGNLIEELKWTILDRRVKYRKIDIENNKSDKEA